MQEYNFYKAIEKINVRTGMYIGDQTLSNVASYLSGYDNAMADAGIREVTSPKFEDFRSWLKARFGFVSDEPGWVNMVLALAVGCDPKKTLPWERMQNASGEVHTKSIKLFFSLVDEYKNGGVRSSVCDAG